jgi:hypothetical protein
LLTTKYSLPPLEFGTLKIFCLDSHVESGEIPLLRASARTNGLKAEPGWRDPWVARLNGCSL